MTALFARTALLPSGVARDVLLTVEDGRFASVEVGAVPPAAAQRLPGVVLPGLANAHSHAFHRALRGRTHDGGGTFWTWREAMYAVAARLDPDSYLTLARAVYAEMALAGITTVGEFHYLHHGSGGVPYADPNAMAEALRQAASEAGVRLTLLDTCYLAGGLDASGHRPLDEVQQRFGDGSVDAWRARVDALRPSDGFRVGSAIHSVRAVPQPALSRVAEIDGPLHVHLSEQPAENEAALAHYGCTPTRLLADTGALGPRTTAVHATHLTGADIGLLGDSGTTVCLCPTTERDLADGIGPARLLAGAGAPLSLGSDQHAVIDLFEEVRGLEGGERVTSLQRGRFSPRALLAAATAHGSLGWPDAGAIAVGRRADLVCVRDDSPRTAGSRADQLLLVATAADVDTVYVDGLPVVCGGVHRLGDVGVLLRDAIVPLWEAS
ncbi:MAG: formimidoylglutamate deiminase [Jatrophihabitans sp.]|uniref:formimidoylglutamate deiminase n=1 Tax=Jatrophihabitans sp. TaxID=1932789 RepID=UPI003F7DEB99